jgi:hypothetical protein
MIAKTFYSSATPSAVTTASLRDVLVRIDTHPASQIDELLPHRWIPPARPVAIAA